MMDEATSHETQQSDCWSKIGNLPALRRRFIEHPGERFYSPQLLYEAEELYEKLVSAAGAGRLADVHEFVGKVRKCYAEAHLRFIEQGILDHLEQQLDDAALHDNDERRRTAVAIIADARAAVADARAGKRASSEVRRIVYSAHVYLRGVERVPGLRHDQFVVLPDLWAPGTFGPPNPPTTVRITERTTNSLTVTWRGRAGIQDANYLLRQRDGGPWEVAASFDETITDWFSFADTGLQPDTRYCYRIRTENSYGSRTTPLAWKACGHPRAMASPRMWRLQFRLRIADVTDAGSSQALQVRLQSPLFNYNPNGNRTWLDYAPRISSINPISIDDDFDRGRDFIYDLTTELVQELSDITMLTLHKEGSNAIGVAQISLLANGVKVFDRIFGETKQTCLWLEEESGRSHVYTVDYPELRAHPMWSSFAATPQVPPLRIPNAEIVSRMEAIIGDQIHSTAAYWRASTTSGVEADKLDDTALRFTVKLKGDGFIDPNIDLRFDLRFVITCSASTVLLIARSENMTSSADFDALYEILSLGAINLVEGVIEDRIEESLQPIIERIEVPDPGVCPEIFVDAATTSHSASDPNPLIVDDMVVRWDRCRSVWMMTFATTRSSRGEGTYLVGQGTWFCWGSRCGISGTPSARMSRRGRSGRSRRTHGSRTQRPMRSRGGIAGRRLLP